MQLKLGNIVEMDTDAIVTAAHSDLRPAPGISQAVFAAADTERLMEACRRIGHCRIGYAVVTPSFGLPCRYIIHVAGTGWYSGQRSERMLFAGCYQQALYKAYACRCRSVALPLMFSGTCHMPRQQALQIVCQIVARFEHNHPDMEIVLVLCKESIYRMAERVWNNRPAELTF